MANLLRGFGVKDAKVEQQSRNLSHRQAHIIREDREVDCLSCVNQPIFQTCVDI